jgi:hypothetical protein
MAEAARKDSDKEAEAQVKANQEAREKNNAEAIERMEKTKPTPTQEENDKAAAGIVVETHEYDGSPPQGQTPEEAVAAAKYYKQDEAKAYVGSKQHRQVESGKSGQYQNRAATTKPAS